MDIKILHTALLFFLLSLFFISRYDAKKVAGWLEVFVLGVFCGSGAVSLVLTIYRIWK